MKIALIDATPKSELYPLPLLKLGAWVKDRGDQCQLFLNGKLPAAKKFDEIWITTRFTFEFWFGKNENEFIALLNYPKIGELAKRKQGALRMQRAIKRNAKKKQ
jgi:hypothetical protein